MLIIPHLFRINMESKEKIECLVCKRSFTRILRHLVSSKDCESKYPIEKLQELRTRSISKKTQYLKKYHQANRSERLESMKQNHAANRTERLKAMKQNYTENQNAYRLPFRDPCGSRTWKMIPIHSPLIIVHEAINYNLHNFYIIF